ncbi:MAG: endonuclease/exonuclease/phosphatase family protein, partial [Prolixibacteraceae bacterium]|nr:endonuclease/exonuclease/phosphatase family protein [Prolixibacteraceae bacterium]
VISNLRKLRQALESHIESSYDNVRRSKSVRIATWNIREFGGTSYKGRSFEELYYIAEIISHFDIISLQEVRADLDELMKLTKYLGPDWSFIATDVTEGHAGNSERMVFLYNRLNVRFRNIAGELTLKEGGKIRASFGERINLERGIKINIDSSHILSGVYNASTITKRGKIHLDEDLEIPLPPECKLDIPAGSSLVLKKGQEIIRPEKGKAQVEIPTGIIEGSQYGLRFPENTFDDSLRQFARTPFLIAFQSGWLKLNLCTVHIYYGSETNVNKLKQRESEIQQLTEALAGKAKNEYKNDRESFLGVLGDFNILGRGHPTMDALESNGFEIPEKLKSIPGSNVARDKAYDQIAFWEPARTTGYTRLDIIGANIFDYFEHIFRNEDEPEYRLEGVDANGLGESTRYSTWRTYKMSDHLPMWIELRTDFGEEYLQSISQE